MSVFTNPATASKRDAQSYIAAILDTLGDSDPIRVLGETPRAIQKAIGGLSRQELSTPEPPGKWSMRQVLAHLADSEIVYSFRLRMVLAQDRPHLAGYDQDLWADRLGYEEIDAAQSLRVFTALRQLNLGLLGRAFPADLKRVGLHEERGEESVEHLVRLYAGHDLVHLRQLERIRDAVTAR